MKITAGSVLAVMVLSVGLTVVGCGPRSPQEKIDKLAENMQAQLPKMLDNDTRLDRVYTNKMELVSEYILIHYPMGEKAREAIKNSIETYLHSDVCKDIKGQLLSEGVSSHYIYKNPQGEVFLDLILKPGDC